LVKDTKRTIKDLFVIKRGCKIYFVIEGSGFLRRMVRNIAGTLLMVGKGELLPDDMKGILDVRDKAQAGPTAPPQGLYLAGVKY
jgi:tRNA pseudouridine38-40 synthase